MKTDSLLKNFVRACNFAFLIVVLACSALILPANSSASEKISMGILPFDVHSDGKIKNLGKIIPDMIAANLKSTGIEILRLDKTEQDVTYDNYVKLRQIGIQNGVDHLIWGSIFAIGGKVSIDVEMINSFDTASPVSFYSEAEDVENLFSSVKNLTKQIAGNFFNRKIITTITIDGNKRIESDAILNIITLRPGDILSPDAVSDNLKKIYKMGYFEDIRVESKQSDKGVALVFIVTEKPTVRNIRFTGNHVFEDKDLKEVVRTGTGSILNIFTLNEDIARIKKLYTDKNYHNSVVNYTIEKLDHNQADISFHIKEGKKIKVRRISFEGNKYFSDKKLKKVMKTEEKGFFSWITSSGDLDKTVLDQDVFRIEAYYKDHGFIDSRISDPEIKYKKKGIYIKFKIKEGQQYRIGKIDFKGDFLISKDKMMQKTGLKPNSVFSRDALRKAVLSLTDVYADKGFANAEVVPSVKRHVNNRKIDISFTMKKGSPVYFNRIMITGNTKTRDKVIRRQLKVYERELYTRSGIQRSLKNLKRLDYFDDIKVNTSKTDKDNFINLDIDVTEKSTGAFSFGGGYSGEDGAFAMASISQKNFLGKGQTLTLQGQLSGVSNKYILSFTEPWLFDIPLSAGFDLYNWEYDYDYYNRNSKGASIRTGYKISDYTFVGLKYTYDDFKISDVDETRTDVTAGTYLTSSLTASVRYDSRDDLFNPTEGSNHSFSVEYAGNPLGGEIEFTKYIAETGWYFPLFWKFTGHLHGKAGYLDDRTKKSIDIDYERFYLGGIDSIRGYDWRDIDATKEGDEVQIGGNKLVQLNAEIAFPIVEKLKLIGVGFYDTGDVYRKGENVDLGDLYSSYGLGLRWYSPMGPIRIAYGIVLNGHQYKSGKGRFDFSMGASF